MTDEQNQSFLNQSAETSNQDDNSNSSQHNAEQQFSQGAQTQQRESNSNNDQPFMVVGDRVFQTKEDAEKNIDSAQKHIQKLESDFEAATNLIDKQQKLLDRSSKVDDIVDAVKTNEQDTSGNAENTSQLSEEDVINKAIDAFEQRQQQKSVEQEKQENWKYVTNSLTQAYGDKTDEVVQKVASENGMSVQDAAQLATSHPKVFLKMFDGAGSSKSTATKPNTSSVNTEAVANQHSQPAHKSILKMSAKERANYVRQKLNEFEE